jgi:tripeptidyl-peptidase-1
MLGNTLFLVLVVGTALCKPLYERWDDVKTKHAWTDGTPEGWEVVGPAPSGERLAVRIGLKQDKFEDLVEHLYAVSDPNHDRCVFFVCCRVWPA